MDSDAIEGCAPAECVALLASQRDNARAEVERFRKALIEEKAMAIYDGLKHQDGWVPWVVGGNSLKQQDCRFVARATVDALKPASGEEGL